MKISKIWKLSLYSCLVFSSFLGGAAHATSLAGDVVVVRALDKVTARTLDLFIEIGKSVKYGTLEITARKCLKRPPEDTPETSTFLEIREVRQDEDALLVFNGWMFASSPALSALEHPVYDVWVIDCKMSDGEAPTLKE